MAKYSNDLFVKRDASFSADRVYRWKLDIVWDESLPMALFCALNPSTADEHRDDPTIRRERGFAESWGCGGMRKINLFAYRSTSPKLMKEYPDPIGLLNLFPNTLHHTCFISGPWIACWGCDGNHMDRHNDFLYFMTKMGVLSRWQCFGHNADGTPKHPLYLKGSTQLIPLVK